MSLPPLVEPGATLSATEAARTARHAVLFPLGEIGQRRLAAAHVAIVGAGGLGSPAVLALAAAGIGRLTVIDDDVVEHSNLQRQIMHRVGDVGALKVDGAVRAAADLAPECEVIPVCERLDPDNARQLLAGADVVLDGTDAFDTREAVAGACDTLGVPLVWGVVQEFHAQVTVFWSRPPAGVPATRLADLHPPGSAGNVPTCADVGVLGALVMQVGSLMATQAILLIAGIGDPLVGRIALVDGLRSSTREVPFRPSVTARARADSRGVAATDRTERSRSAAAPTPAGATIDAGELVTLLGAATAGDGVDDGSRADASATPDGASTAPQAATPLIVDVREADERATIAIPGSVWLPVGEILADPNGAAARLRADAGDREVITVCAVGVRSARATAALASAGMTTRSLAGGMRAWASLAE
ncbi:HesA/MoeB/ThiF family protein [Microbacterium karelineae]|uniref:HesA/MoeB/ThiF family protein n=1 Tax=Microbacterium karelineae TaxID=2654283 RepID=UPI0012EA5026|nr:HesA/MoeB/ThiF family protein [Microbacterium karelineae]